MLIKQIIIVIIHQRKLNMCDSEVFYNRRAYQTTLRISKMNPLYVDF